MIEPDFRSDLNYFLEQVATAASEGSSDDIPHVEAPRKIVEYINRGKVKSFDEVGWCVFNGVKVFEMGKRQEVLDREARDAIARAHGKMR